MFICFQPSPVTSWKQIPHSWDFTRQETVSTKEFSPRQRYSTLLGVLKLKCPSAVPQRFKTIHEQCVCRRMELHSLSTFLLRRWDRNKDCTKEEGDKRLRMGGSGCEPTLSRAFCNPRWANYPNKSTINLSGGPRGTRASSNWPTSVLCVADGRRSCPNESSWSPRWNPCSRLGNTHNKMYSTDMHGYLRFYFFFGQF